jgi:hypothetical protein
MANPHAAEVANRLPDGLCQKPSAKLGRLGIPTFGTRRLFKRGRSETLQFSSTENPDLI